jgi:hypothetical protein
MSIRFPAIVLGLLLGAPTSADAQKIRVAVDMTDSAAAGVFSSAFSTAFRSLGDVEVVSVLEKPELVLQGVVLCTSSDCANTSWYALSLRLYSPYDPDVGWYLARALIPSLPNSTHQARLDSAAKVVNEMLADYEESHMTWTVHWSRVGYEQSVREFVGRIDARCLEKKRAFQRVMASSDTSRFATYTKVVRSRTWLC